jgi:hypothetical protein
MRRLLGWIAGAVGGVAAYRWLRRRPQVAAEPLDPDGRADKLRAKLAETRADEPPVEEEPESPDERRRHVHEEGRATLDEMQSE